MTDTERYQAALDALYAGYMRNHDLVAGLFDRDFKDPEVILAVARKLDLLPRPEQVVKITGSKGKGSTTRLIAHYLRQVLGADAKVSLFVSPEEFDHTDRMKINDAEISQAEFANCYEALRPHLDEAQSRLASPAYLSPFGIMLLIALMWFKQQGAHWHVLETGRGAAHDEVGMMPGALAVITSILFEHPGNLGPAICDIAREKAAIATASRRTIASAQALAQLDTCGLTARLTYESEAADLPLRPSLPHWLALDDRLARQAVVALTQTNDKDLLALNIGGISAAWGTGRHDGADIVYDAMINLDSLDRAWFERTIAARKALILYSLPDDKDRDRLKRFLATVSNAACREIILLGKRVYLKYDEAEALAEGESARVHYEDRAGFMSELSEQIAKHKPEVVYCFGTQTYIRLVKAALAPSRRAFSRADA